jgi:hypothetical protein
VELWVFTLDFFFSLDGVPKKSQMHKFSSALADAVNNMFEKSNADAGLTQSFPSVTPKKIRDWTVVHVHLLHNVINVG